MKPRLQLVAISLLLALVVGGLYAYKLWDQWFDPSGQAVSQQDQPDMVARSVQQVSYNDRGERQYQLIAESMEQFLAQNHNLMIQPDVTFYRDQKASWTTSSAEAVSDGSGEELHLTGNVLIQQRGVEQGATLETETLLLYPERSFATTDDKVIIRQQGIYIEAKGLEADLNNNRLILKNNVTSIYEPENS